MQARNMSAAVRDMWGQSSLADVSVRHMSKMKESGDGAELPADVSVRHMSKTKESGDGAELPADVSVRHMSKTKESGDGAELPADVSVRYMSKTKSDDGSDRYNLKMKASAAVLHSDRSAPADGVPQGIGWLRRMVNQATPKSEPQSCLPQILCGNDRHIPSGSRFFPTRSW